MRAKSCAGQRSNQGLGKNNEQGRKVPLENIVEKNEAVASTSQDNEDHRREKLISELGHMFRLALFFS